MTRIAHTKTFKSGNSVAVRLPKELGLAAGLDVEISRNGDTITIRRKSHFTGSDLIKALDALPRPDRVMEREPIDFPERPGL